MDQDLTLPAERPVQNVPGAARGTTKGKEGGNTTPKHEREGKSRNPRLRGCR